MKHFFALIIFASLSLFSFARGLQRPKLVVGIVIDQMRWDYLYRYYDRFGADGFKRLMKDGFNCQSTTINYLPSYTAPGHATIYTGTVPSIHGIAANDWINTTTHEAWYCTDDPGVTPVGGSYAACQMSPRNMLVTTITDELRLASNFQSKVFGIAIKDRGSILPAGHMANGAYWFDDSTGHFVSSSFYGPELPQWLVAFNRQGLAEKYIREDWNLLYPARTYTSSLADDNKYEGKFEGEQAPVFPRSVAGIKDRGYYGLRYMPAGNTITFRAAEACIEGEDMGGGGRTDFLCLSFSSTDYAGHQFTPNSVEMEDMFLRFDKELGQFLKYLDKRLGEGNYLIFLTADHGAAHNAQLLKDQKVPAGTESSITVAALNGMLKERFGSDSLVWAATNYQLFFDEAAIVRAAVPRADVRRYTLAWLRQQAAIAYAIDMEQIANDLTPEPLKTMVINGHNGERSGSIQVILKPGWYMGNYTTGTTHGTWNPYDTRIPLLWYGRGIPSGETHRSIRMTDIAPTLAALLRIQVPNGCIGEVITEIFEGGD